MYSVNSAITTVIVVSVIAYAAWATLRIQTLTDDVEMLHELLKLARREMDGNDE